MNRFLAKISGIFYVLFGSIGLFGQSSYKMYLRSAYDSAKVQNYSGANTLLRKAQALKGIDTGYSESFNLYLAINYQSLNQIDTAIYFFGEALKYYESIGNDMVLSNICSRLGDIELKFTHRLDKAVLYFQKERNYRLSIKDSVKFFVCLTNISITHLTLKQYDSALLYLTKVLANPSVQNTSKLAARRAMADTYAASENYGLAIKNYNLVIGELPADDSTNLFVVYNNKGDCLMKQKKYEECLICFLQARKYFTESVAENDRQILYFNLADVYSKIGNYERAFYFKDLESRIKDSINTQSIVQVATEVEARYETRKNKDSLVISQQTVLLTTSQSNDRQRKFIITLVSAAVVCLLAFLALRNATLRKKANTKLAAQKAKVELLAGKLEEANQTKTRLFSIISHDLRSPVSSIYATLKMQELKGNNGNGNAAVSGQIMNLLDTLEDLLTWSKSQMDRFTLQPVTLRIPDMYNDLIELYQDAAAAKQITIVNKAERQVKVYTDENLLKTILRNVLANSINHAPNKSTVIVDVIAYEAGVMCTISNEATATDAAMLEARLQTGTIGSSKHGLGNVLIKEFTEKLNAGFEVTYKGGKVYLQIIVPSMQKLSQVLVPTALLNEDSTIS